MYDLPVIVIETPDGEEIKSRTKRKENCKVSVVQDNRMMPIDFAGIRGRGNSTWTDSPQKPYDIALKEDHSMLGMNSSQQWILLASGYFDRTQLHNATAFEMARLTDYPWVQEGRFVELMLNGEHKGLYYLCEKVEPGENKINMSVSTDESGDGYLSSYLLETECYPYEGDDFFVTDYINTTGWTFGDREMEQSIIPYALYYRQLMKDPFFVQRLREKWTNYKSIWEQRIPSFIDEQYGNIRRAALRNETMYTNMYTKNEEVLIRATQCDGRENFRE